MDVLCIIHKNVPKKMKEWKPCFFYEHLLTPWFCALCFSFATLPLENAPCAVNIQTKTTSKRLGRGKLRTKTPKYSWTTCDMWNSDVWQRCVNLKRAWESLAVNKGPEVTNSSVPSCYLDVRTSNLYLWQYHILPYHTRYPKQQFFNGCFNWMI